MNCSEVQKTLSAYYDGELTKDTRESVEIHLSECTGCTQELTGYKKLSSITSEFNSPVPSELIWSQLEHQLDQQPVEVKPLKLLRSKSFRAPNLFAFAATVLVAVGIGWFTYHSWFMHSPHDQFSVEFGHYLEEFQREPDTAQQILLARYESHLIDPDKSIEQVGYRPAVADGLPEGYSLESTHVIKMPCCTCVQSICKRDDGTTLAFFEHDDDATTEWFGDRPEVTANCNGKQCCLVELDEQIAASWKRGTHYITLIGVRDVAEINQMVAWFDKNKHPGPN